MAQGQPLQPGWPWAIASGPRPPRQGIPFSKPHHGLIPANNRAIVSSNKPKTSFASLLPPTV